MPFEWVEPDVVLNYKGVVVYHVYENDLKESVILENRYGYDVACDEETDSFNIDALPNYSQHKQHIEILREAIDRGFLTSEGLSQRAGGE